MGSIISRYKDPHTPTSTMECQNGFDRCSFGYIAILLHCIGIFVDAPGLFFSSLPPKQVVSIFFPKNKTLEHTDATHIAFLRFISLLHDDVNAC